MYIARLKAADMRMSMDGKGRALDTIFTERLWKTITRSTAAFWIQYQINGTIIKCPISCCI